MHPRLFIEIICNVSCFKVIVQFENSLGEIIDQLTVQLNYLDLLLYGW